MTIIAHTTNQMLEVTTELVKKGFTFKAVGFDNDTWEIILLGGF